MVFVLYFRREVESRSEKCDVNHLYHSLHSPHMVLSDTIAQRKTGHINAFMAMDLYGLDSIFLPGFSTFLLN